MKKLLDFIGEIEANGNYNAFYNNTNSTDDLSRHTIDQIIALQKKRVNSGAASSAIGKYQFISPTLLGLKRALSLKGNEKFTPTLQDKLAIQLFKGRGLDQWLANKLGDAPFANNLAKEWASLPVVTAMQGARMWLEPGQTYYAGDKLNKALTTPAEILAVLAETRGEEVVIEFTESKPTLQRGDRGESVAHLQNELGKIILPRIQPDGIFGKGTEAAVVWFQHCVDLDADGVVGPATWAAIEEKV